MAFILGCADCQTFPERMDWKAFGDSCDDCGAKLRAWILAPACFTPIASAVMMEVRTPTRTTPSGHQRKHLGDYLRDELADGRIDFAIRARIERREIFGAEQDVVRFYIHPSQASGDTQDYFIALVENAGLAFVDTLDAPWPDE